MKLIIDCDVGIDDAYAIMLASVTRNIEILAINVVHGNSTLDDCAVNTKLVVDKIFGQKQQPPIYIGARHPIIGSNTSYLQDYLQDSYHGFDGLAGVRDSYFANEVDCIKQTWHERNQYHASLKLIELVEQHPNEITIVALGPLTNLALAFRMSNDPVNFSGSIKQLVIMGGNEWSSNTMSERVEFNFARDPIATKIVIEEMPKCPKTVCTFEMTLRQFNDVDLELVYSVLSDYSMKSEKCKFMQTIGFHRQPDGKFKDYISCDFITMMVALYENEFNGLVKSIPCSCLIDIVNNKGLITINGDKDGSIENTVQFVSEFDKGLVSKYLTECFKKLSS